ncbi:MAG: hypothetical protein J5875_13045 [Paludibacteraceae bacterium]|nr:hypothetical protein [Paludibacteraceae bacterium]
MKTFLKFIITAVLLLTTGHLQAQTTVYPIQLNAVMLPPYTNCLGDYFNSGANRAQVKAILRDISRYGGKLNFSLSVKVKQGNTVLLESVTPNPIMLTNANLINDLREYVQQLFSPTTLRHGGNYAENGYCLPEGAYEFVFQAFDYYKKDLPLSEPFSLFCFLQQAEPPVLVYPEDGACGINQAIGLSDQGVQFQWMDPIAYGPSNKVYEFVLTEKSGGANLVSGMFSNASSSENPLNMKVYNENVYNNTFRYIPATAGILQKGKEYCWHVIAKGGNLGGGNTAFKNGGKSKTNCFVYGDCPAKEEFFDSSKVKKIDNNLKVILEKVDVNQEEKSAEAFWKPEKGDFCKYYVYYYRTDLTDASAEKAVIDGLSSLSTVLKNLEPGKEYACYVIGATNCNKENEPEILSPKSDEYKFKLAEIKMGSDNCEANLDPIVCENLLEDLNEKDYFYGTTSSEIITVTEITNKGSDNSFSGSGIVSCTLLKNKLGLNVSFDNIKINSDHYLCKGKVLVKHDETKDNLLINLNDWTGKNQGAKESPQQENLGDEVKNLDEAKKHPNETVIYNGKLYAVDENGNPQEVGEVKKKEDLCDKPTSGLDLEDGGVVFDVEPGLNQGKYDPYIDKYASPFTDDNITKGYKPQCSGYSVPWISMVEGEVRYIVARKGGKAKEAESSTKMDNIDFYCYAADGSAVKLEKEPYKDGMVKVKIYGGLKNTALEIYARENAEKTNGECQGNEKTYGLVEIYTMSHQTKKILLAPVLNEMTLNIEQMQNEVNKKFAPLGKKFEFVVGEAYTKEKDPNLASLLENGLNTNENENHFTMETKEMKYIRKNYVNYISKTADCDACLFLVPEAAKPGLQGYMPLLGSVGYIFVGKQPSLDANTITHELCHGLFCIQHVFDYNGVAEGGLPENIMDYPKSDSKITDRYLTKYFQWKDVENERHIHLSFLDDPEDSEMPDKTIETGIEIAGEKVEEYMKTGDWTFTEDNLSDLLDAAYEDSPEAGKALIKTYRELYKAWECAVTGQSIEYCLCNQGNDLLKELLEFLADKGKDLVDDNCDELDNFLLGDICREIKEFMDDTPGWTYEQIREKFCNKYAPKKENSYLYSEVIAQEDYDGGTCIKYRINAVSGNKVRLKEMKVNDKAYTIKDNEVDFKNKENFDNRINSMNIGRNQAVRVKKGDKNWELAGWFWEEVKKSCKNDGYYGEHKVFNHSEVIIANVCCTDDPVTVPTFEMTFSYDDKDVTDFFTNEPGQNTIKLQNYLCASKAIEQSLDTCHEYKLTEAHRKLYPNVELVKKSGVWYASVNGIIDNQYKVKIVDPNPDKCLAELEKCKVRFDNNVKNKFNLPLKAKLIVESGKYYVTFDSKSHCCTFKFEAKVKDCELELVYLDVPDYIEIEDGIFYYNNELKQANDITWPKYHINCEGLYVNGKKVSYDEYFTIDLIKKYYIEIYCHWMMANNGYQKFEESLNDFCKEGKQCCHSFTLIGEWENMIKGSAWVGSNHNSILDCYSPSIDWNRLQNDVIQDLKSFTNNCNATPMNCLLAKLISSMSSHMYEDYANSKDFIITKNGKDYIPYHQGIDPQTQEAKMLSLTTTNGNVKTGSFENSLSETVLKLYVFSYNYLKNFNHWSVIMYDGDNHISAFSNVQDLVSMPYWLINFNCGCK